MAIGTVKGGVEWTIPDFISLRGWYESPPFSSAAASWWLWIGVSLTSEGGGRTIELWLRSMTPGPPIDLEFSFSLKTRDGRKCEERRGTMTFYSTESCYIAGIFVDSHTMNEYLSNGTLTILCTLQRRNADGGDTATAQCSYCKGSFDAQSISSHEKKCLDKPVKCPECSDVVLLQNWYDHECHDGNAEGEDCTCKSSCHLHKTKVMRDFQELFLKKEDCDVVIKVKEREFRAHKNILKARSPVLASTFRCDMKERATGIVDVEDCDPSSFSDFLCYLYCGVVENLSGENVFSLFAAADKYDVQDLRAECLQFMKENLSVDTFCDTLSLALRHSETELIKLTTDFFTKNAPKIIVTVKWQNFSADNPTESNELFIKLLVPNKN